MAVQGGVPGRSLKLLTEADIYTFGGLVFSRGLLKDIWISAGVLSAIEAALPKGKRSLRIEIVFSCCCLFWVQGAGVLVYFVCFFLLLTFAASLASPAISTGTVLELCVLTSRLDG